ncbi:MULTISPECIES: DUF6094 domain-containing protein [Burkholderia]|uniref:DUF6094 domain-containing protein n=1 Tax=Burkholderia pseudomultivorans TaxID=1207504 RepID=A0ABU2ECV1_9BURK|nr:MULTISPECIES: DUF6094 domain-containing protein [Burkholderia]MBR8428317.1 SAM-dependent methyltransferase [Burkholderia cenocepacia]MDN7669351.1 DUF6094 domain-containing protein [Burkholderia vietnamiensis]MDR8731193.1 hypothetical protein [Burkholderia pseudomultivorans]MDR8738718.1 hypothetical protein [Burkholderia pseudomultivorans]MDR8745369.1 hypothetical protein [Burkholderia pseudomultivorans]
MALIFPRLARNFIKNGYFPTDDETLGRISHALALADPERSTRLLDPCCGEGAALHGIKAKLDEAGASPDTLRAYGVEYDHERAWHAKSLLDTVAHTDVHDMFITARSMGLLFLNPPYGDVVSDKAQTGNRQLNRLEKVFYQETVPWLAFGGVLVLIVPYYVIDREFATMIARNFSQVQVFLAPEQAFKQLVLFGIKRRADGVDNKVAAQLARISDGELPPVLPESGLAAPYAIPAVPGDCSFVATRIDALQLEQELGRLEHATLWPHFASMFSSAPVTPRRPLRDLSNWHLALALAAGQITGVVTGQDGTRLLVRGDTIKRKEQEVQIEETDKGDIRTTILMRDRFVPTIAAIDFTPGANLGRIVTIR